jgi:hypothetical protein
LPYIGGGSLAPLDRVAVHQLVEIAALSSISLILDQQSQVSFLKLVEPFVPVDRFQRLCSAVPGEIDPNHAYIPGAAASAHAGGTALSFFGPLPDFV